MDRTETQQPTNSDKAGVFNLHQQLIQAWNDRNAHSFAGLFEENGNTIGFDGSQLNGRTAIEATLEQIFADHQTATFITKIKEIRNLHDEVILLRAIAGMIPPGKSKIDPSKNAIQSLIAILHNGNWKIALFQNTPARFDGRPELARELTRELAEFVEV